jgi:virulence-associated protein VapD
MTMYAITYQLDRDALRRACGNREINPDAEIRRILQQHGFTWQQGTLYFGDERVDAVMSCLAAMDLAKSLPWFAASVREMRLLRITDVDDLMPAVRQGAQ